MLLDYKRGQTSVIFTVFLRDSSVATGAGLTGLTYSSSGLIVATRAENESSVTAYKQSASNIETISTLGTYAAPTSGKCRFKEVDSTNMPGVYEVQIADARFAVTSAKHLLVLIFGATNLAPTPVLIPLRDFDPYDAVRGGLTALPNAACSSNASLITSGTGTAQLSVSGGNANADVKKINAVATTSVTTVSAYQGSTQPLNFTGTGVSALVQGDAVDIAGAAVSTSSAQIGVNVVNVGGTAQTAKDLGAINVTTLNTLSGHDPGGTLASTTNITAATGIDVTKLAGSTTAATNAANGWAGLIADSGTAQAGASTTITLRSGASATNDLYTGAAITVLGGTGAGQTRKITGYVGGTKVATVDSAWATNPDSSSTYQILGRLV